MQRTTDAGKTPEFNWNLRKQFVIDTMNFSFETWFMVMGPHFDKKREWVVVEHSIGNFLWYVMNIEKEQKIAKLVFKEDIASTET